MNSYTELDILVPTKWLMFSIPNHRNREGKTTQQQYMPKKPFVFGWYQSHKTSAGMVEPFVRRGNLVTFPSRSKPLDQYQGPFTSPRKTWDE